MSILPMLENDGCMRQAQDIQGKRWESLDAKVVLQAKDRAPEIARCPIDGHGAAPDRSHAEGRFRDAQRLNRAPNHGSRWHILARRFPALILRASGAGGRHRATRHVPCTAHRNRRKCLSTRNCEDPHDAQAQYKQEAEPAMTGPDHDVSIGSRHDCWRDVSHGCVHRTSGFGCTPKYERRLWKRRRRRYSIP